MDGWIYTPRSVAVGSSAAERAQRRQRRMSGVEGHARAGRR